MSSLPISPERIARIAGFGMGSAADGYVFRPTSVEAVQEVFNLAAETGRKVVLRGAGRSYGDASILPEALVLDITKMNRILSWDSESGVIEVEAGVTIEGLWRHTLEDGWWPPVVSGTMYPTLAGALAMNIHGKNAFAVGPIGNHVLEFDLVVPTGELRTVKNGDELFFAVISSAGLLGVITRVKLQMKKVHSGDLRVLPISAAGWDEQFATLLEFDDKADYMVSWVDCFAKGSKAGRGLVHVAWYQDEGSEFPSSFKQSHQDLPDTVMGFLPKSMVWRFLKKLNRRWGMRKLNWAKYAASKKLGNGKPISESLVGFSFLLDYVPNWRWAYLPGGFIQYQSFVPKEHAPRVFAEQVRLMQEAKMEAFLGVLKRHKPDDFLLSHGVDGFSLALDFKVTAKNWPRVQALCHKMNDLVLQAGGRFYFAKDSTLRPADVRAYLGEEVLAKFRGLKRELDPDGLLYSSLAERVELLG
ncbi:MAG: FAD-binding oxidoreductase [Fimbriimonadaceae bacterium]|nr:FAD-binding oxidoreductase [Fimbriimonadaceae bacterium]